MELKYWWRGKIYKTKKRWIVFIGCQLHKEYIFIIICFYLSIQSNYKAIDILPSFLIMSITRSLAVIRPHLPSIQFRAGGKIREHIGTDESTHPAGAGSLGM